MICTAFDKYEGYEDLPLPPPWRKIQTQGEGEYNVEYSNDITKEVTDRHPFLRYIINEEVNHIEQYL